MTHFFVAFHDIAVQKTMEKLVSQRFSHAIMIESHHPHSLIVTDDSTWLERCDHGLLLLPSTHAFANQTASSWSVLSQPCHFNRVVSALDELYHQRYRWWYPHLKLQGNLLSSHDGKRHWNLTDKETDIIAYLLTRPHYTASRQELLDHIWQDHPDIETHKIETHIYHLRQKLDDQSYLLSHDECRYQLYLSSTTENPLPC